MKFLYLFAIFALFSCNPDEPEPIPDDTTQQTPEEWTCGTYKGHQLYTGPKGGCYYKNSNGNKTYVDRVNCNCN